MTDQELLELAAHIRPTKGKTMIAPQGTKTSYTDDLVMHVVPLNDLREHEASTKCWCNPTEDEDWPDIWVHHSMDEREEYEEGRKPT